jgi:hypothetical protein
LPGPHVKEAWKAAKPAEKEACRLSFCSRPWIYFEVAIAGPLPHLQLQRVLKIGVWKSKVSCEFHEQKLNANVDVATSLRI